MPNVFIVSSISIFRLSISKFFSFNASLIICAVTEPKILGQPIADKTAIEMKSMLTNVIDNGFDRARISGYDVAGKTGTAQISDPEEGGYLEEFIHNFAAITQDIFISEYGRFIWIIAPIIVMALISRRIVDDHKK